MNRIGREEAMRIDKLKAELSKAREKAAEWQARAKEIERQITELENTEILQMVRGVAASPEELRELLDRIRSEEHTSELQSRFDLVCRLLLEKKKKITRKTACRQQG